MRNYQSPPTPKPVLKPKPEQLRILSILPKPPTQHREIPSQLREEVSPKRAKPGEVSSLADKIDYDKLTVNQQAKWDAGMFGSVHLRSDKKNPYYCLRWIDPKTKRQRSTKLADNYPDAIAKLKKLTIGV
jgi:hypothetical protein